MGPLSLTPVATTNIWRVQSVSLRPLPQPAAPSLRHRPRSMCFQTSSPAHQFTELAPPASASPPSVSAASQHHLRIVCPIAENPLRPRPGLYTWPSALLLGLACTSSRTSCLARPLNRCNCARHGVAIAFSFRVACHWVPSCRAHPTEQGGTPRLSYHIRQARCARCVVLQRSSFRADRCTFPTVKPPLSAPIVCAPVRTLRPGTATRRRGSRIPSCVARTYIARDAIPVLVPSHENSHREMRCGG